MTTQAVRPVVNPTSLPEIIDNATSSTVAKKIISWTISQLLYDRGVFPPNDSVFRKSEFHNSGEVMSLLYQHPVKGKKLSETQEGINKVIDVLRKVFEGIVDKYVRAVTIQFNDGIDEEKTYESWRIELDYEESGGNQTTNISTYKIGGTSGRKDLASKSSVQDGDQFDLDLINNQVLRAIKQMKEATSMLHSLDYINNDIRLAVEVEYTQEAYDKAKIPTGFVICSKSTYVENASRFRICPKTQFGYHNLEIKLKTSLFDHNLEKKRKNSPKRNSKASKTVKSMELSSEPDSGVMLTRGRRSCRSARR